MLIDEIRTRWNEVTLNKSEYLIKRLFGKRATTEEWDMIRNLIDSSVVFNINNVYTYIHNKSNSTFTYLDVPNVRPPYNLMWFEWVEPYSWGTVSPGMVVQSEWDKERNVGVSYAHIFLKDETKMVMPFFLAKWEWDEKGIILGEGTVAPDHNMSDNEIELVCEATHNNLLPPLMAISFMHCKNVTLIDETIPEKLQRARECRGKLPLVNFKTLEIKPMMKILCEEGQSETQGLKKALHICRGHFKDYSKGKGLFGRDKGMYWWESQVRGNITEGLTLKDYKVSPN